MGTPLRGSSPRYGVWLCEAGGCSFLLRGLSNSFLNFIFSVFCFPGEMGDRTVFLRYGVKCLGYAVCEWHGLPRGLWVLREGCGDRGDLSGVCEGGGYRRS